MSLHDQLLERCHLLRRLIDSGPDGPQRLVDELHGRGQSGVHGAQLMLNIMTNGWLRHGYEDLDAPKESTTTFVGLCYELQRLDVLRSVIEAGKPAWVVNEDIASPSDWMRTLSTRDAGFGPYHKSLYHLAADRPSEVAREALDLMAEFDPDHIDVDLLADSYPETRAMWLRVLMERRIGHVVRQPQDRGPAIYSDTPNSCSGAAPGRRARSAL